MRLLSNKTAESLLYAHARINDTKFTDPKDGGAVISYLGIDIGGTKVAFRAVNEGPLTYETAFRWGPPGPLSQDLEVLAKNVETLRRCRPEPIEAVGVAMPATVDGAGRVVTWPSRPTWAGLDLADWLGRLFGGAVVRWADDGDLAALAEAHEADCEDLVYLGVGTGTGGGIVLGGRVCPGSARGSCEIGHMIIDRSGPRCDCGRLGCLQAIASGPATLRRAAALRGGDVSFDDFKTALERSRGWASAAVRECWAALAIAVVSLDELIHPQQFLIGGGFAAGLPGFASGVSRHAAELLRPGQSTVRVRGASLGGLSSLHGAVLLARGVT